MAENVSFDSPLGKRHKQKEGKRVVDGRGRKRMGQTREQKVTQKEEKNESREEEDRAKENKPGNRTRQRKRAMKP